MTTMRKEARLLELLRKQTGMVSADYLAKQQGVSTRTIRTYIKVINQTAKEAVVRSSNKGYALNIDLYEAAMLYFDDGMPQTANERQKYMLSTLVIKEDEISIYQLSEELSVSEATILLDLKKVGKRLADQGMTLLKRGEFIRLIGTEKEKRGLIRNLFSEEAQDQTAYFFTFQDILTDGEVDEIKQIVIYQLEKYNIKMNEFMLSNLILHLIVAIMRLKSDQYMDSAVIQMPHQSMEYTIAKDIFTAILNRHPSIVVNDEEIQSLTTLLIGNTVGAGQPPKIKKEIQEMITAIVEGVNQQYLIDLQNNEFKVRFSIHLENLLRRYELGIVNKNPLTHSLKSTYPMIYDVGLFVSTIIHNYTGYVISEDEIAYLALHLGIFFNEQIEQHTVSVSIICPDYNGLNERLVQSLKKYFKEKIVIREVVKSYLDVTKALSADLVVTTMPYESSGNQLAVQISPLLTEQDLNRIEKAVLKIASKKKVAMYQDYTKRYIRESLFFTTISCDNKYEYIQFVGQELVNQRIIDQVYCESVLERERMASTFFENCAMPHSLLRSAEETVLAILYNDDLMRWDEHDIGLIIFMSLSNDNQDGFNNYLQLLIRIMSHKTNVVKLRQTKSCSVFIEILNQLIEEEIENDGGN